MPYIYQVFAGDMYYPGGGMNDYRGSFPTQLEAMRHIADHTYDWWQVATADTDGCLVEIDRGGEWCQ